MTVLAGILGAGGGRGGFGGPRGGGGGTGRLEKILVREKQLAVSVAAFHRSQWYVGAFQFAVRPVWTKASSRRIWREIWAEIENIKTDGVTGDEIQKIKNRSEANFVRSLSFSAGLASAVGRADFTGAGARSSPTMRPSRT